MKLNFKLFLVKIKNESIGQRGRVVKNNVWVKKKKKPRIYRFFFPQKEPKLVGTFKNLTGAN